MSLYKHSVDCCQQLKNSFFEEAFFFFSRVFLSLLPVFLFGYIYKCFILVCALCFLFVSTDVVVKHLLI